MTLLARLQNISLRTYVLIGGALVLLQGIVLLAMGQPVICECGYVELWHGVIDSGNSQHLTDWYTLSHVIHGFLFYGAIWLVARGRWSLGLALVLAIVVEAGWEILENTPWIIDRYRTATISLEYHGDSIINSVFDTLAMIVGFVLASRWSVWIIVILAVAMELYTGYMIRDNLTLNIVMLLYPSESVLNWQSGG